MSEKDDEATISDTKAHLINRLERKKIISPPLGLGIKMSSSFFLQSLPFPVVTICNFNALKLNSLLDSNLTALKATFPARSKFIRVI